MSHERTTWDVHVTGRRVVATLLDAVVFGVVSCVISLISGTRTSTGSDMTKLSTGRSVPLFLFVILYYVVLEGLLGRTVGKMITGLRVVDANTGGVPGLGSAALRTLLRFVDGIGGYLVGFIVVLSSKNRRRLGDMAARTLVVRA